MPTIAVIAPDAFNMDALQALGADEGIGFVPILSYDDVRETDDLSVDALLPRLNAELDALDTPPDGIVGFFDFPVSTVLPLLCDPRGLPSPSLEAVVKLEHKYWARVIQREHLPQHGPAFAAFDPWGEDPWRQIGMSPPFWIKPIKSFRSHLGFRIANHADLDVALAEVREHLPRIGDSFNELLTRLDVPEDIAAVDGNHMLAEAIIGGRQCTLEGFAYRGEVEIYGIVDSIRHPNRTTFLRYEYPSQLPTRVQRRMVTATTAFMQRVGFRHGPFNCECFYDAKRDRVWVLEVNPRSSQSHGELFAKVDGVSNHQIAVDLALDRRPDFPHREGRRACAAKVFLREMLDTYQGEDAIVRGLPDQATIERLEEELPGTKVSLLVEEGTRLSELRDQDAYSRELGAVHIGAPSRAELRRRMQVVRERLQFTLEPTTTEAAT